MSEDDSDRQVARATGQHDVPAGTEPRRAGDSEITFVVLAVLAMAFLTVPLVEVVLDGGDLLGAAFLTFGFYATAASLIALAWALVRHRGRVVAKVWWTLAVLVTFHVVTEVYFAMTTPACSQAVPC